MKRTEPVGLHPWLRISRLGVLYAVFALVLAGAVPGAPAAAQQSIDRRALVKRHEVVLDRFDVESPLSVGNGEFAFTADVTGLQTFPEAFTNTIPLGTLSQWGWHTAPNPEGWSIEKFKFTEFDSHGQRVGYADIPGNRRTPEINWLRANPHRLHLGQIGFALSRTNGTAATTNDLMGVRQTLDLWEGILRSRFSLDGETVMVETLCHPTLDLVAVRVRSALVASGRLGIDLRFPYGTGQTTAADWTHPESHTTTLNQVRAGVAEFDRRLDGDGYHVSMRWSGAGQLKEMAQHHYRLVPDKHQTELELVVAFSPARSSWTLPDFTEVNQTARQHWSRFWSSGGVVDLSGSTDPRWRELERRVVLSQYLTAIQCAGSMPPQESGLTFNSWEGKFHLEMHPWHAAHFALWNRLPLLERSLGYYNRVLPQARATAHRQGYAGARWPKMTGPQGVESPSPVGPFLIWQQSHPIFFAELCYRQHRDELTLKKFRNVVFETAAFMVSFAAWGEETRRFVLGPPLQCAQEAFPKDRTMNPTYELTYWRWGLETAQLWRERLGMTRAKEWDRVLQHLARPPMDGDRYLFAETARDTYSAGKWNEDHPSVTAALGLLPGPGIDRDCMRRTLDWIWTNWNWADTWGWDYPMVAMCAARTGQPARAVDALLMDTPKNRYRANGHNHQRPGLTVYLPGNGGLLYAVAMMAAGWEGAPDRPSPGFPADGTWVVRQEGLIRAP